MSSGQRSASARVPSCGDWLAAEVAAFAAAEPPRPPAPRLGRLRAQARLAAGRPLLHEEPLALDVAFVARLAARLLQEAARHGEPRAADAAHALRAAPLQLAALVEEAFVGHREHLEQLTATLGPAQPVLLDALEQATLPLLRLAAAVIRDHLAGVVWGRAYCPVCGALGLPADAATLRCPRCDTAWPGRPTPGASAFSLELGSPRPLDAEEWWDD